MLSESLPMQFNPPMTMMDFFRKSAGTWFIQRTIHHFDVVAHESGESNLFDHLLLGTPLPFPRNAAKDGAIQCYPSRERGITIRPHLAIV
jgi:CpeS-like protein